jgi:hypothetical protein
MSFLVGIGDHHCDPWSVWELDWLRLPSAHSASLVGSASPALTSTSFAQWHYQLGNICGSRLSTLACCGLLGDTLVMFLWINDMMVRLANSSSFIFLFLLSDNTSDINIARGLVKHELILHLGTSA